MAAFVRKLTAILLGAENALGCVLLALIALVPAIEVLLRSVTRATILGSTEYIQHLVVWVAFAGAAVTSREGKHLSLSAGVDLMPPRIQSVIRTLVAAVSAGVSACLTFAAFQYVNIGFDPDQRIGVLPIRWVMWVVPAGMALITLRFVTHAPKGVVPKVAALLGIAIAAGAGFGLQSHAGALVWPVSLVLVAAAFVGAPIFIVLSGLAAILFFNAGGAIAVIPNEAYTMLTGPVMPTIPLFTLAGFILSESKAGERLVALFRSLFAWMPGGLAIMAAAACAFFTTFTGASGVTILAMGGLLAYVLTQSRYPAAFTTGLLTAAGSIGLLFPPSLPVILYGVVAQVNIKHVFLGGVIPGILMVGALGVLGVIAAVRHKADRTPFDIRKVGGALTTSTGEVLLPVFIIVCFFGGITSIVETAAISVLYALVLEVLIHRDIKIRQVPAVFLKCLPIIGGVLVILAFANALSYFIVDAEIPVQLAGWCTAHISSKYVFLLVLNMALLVVGCFLDIFSATVVVVPLILPLAVVYDIHPVHLGIIFLANMELGYLTPPVGLNLFLASYRFEQPLTKIYRQIMPFLLALFATVLLITYVPWMTLALLPK